ncbi:MAG: peptide deformylase [Nitrospinae bacterium]|nr:peptide deformylase [Nitrospinota bacterium]
MSILKVARLGNPVLRQTAATLTAEEINSLYVQKLIDDMVETMREYEGVGLAAPQVHESKQIVVIESAGSIRYSEAPNIPLTILINPVISYYSEEKADGWEGCLSVGDFRGVVPRSTSVKVDTLNRKGKKVSIDASGFFAIALQHEIDHLNGIVFLDRMKDLKNLSFLKEYERYWAKE